MESVMDEAFPKKSELTLEEQWQQIVEALGDPIAKKNLMQEKQLNYILAKTTNDKEKKKIALKDFIKVANFSEMKALILKGREILSALNQEAALIQLQCTKVSLAIAEKLFAENEKRWDFLEKHKNNLSFEIIDELLFTKNQVIKEVLAELEAEKKTETYSQSWFAFMKPVVNHLVEKMNSTYSPTLPYSGSYKK